MENASKALIIAGAVLISIVIVTIGVMLVNGGQGLFNQGGKMMAQQEIDAFNSTFTAYEGKQTGSQTKALLSKIATHNSTNSDDVGRQVKVTIDGTALDAITQTGLSGAKAKVSSGSAYDVAFTYDGESNLINGVTITKK